MSRDHYRSNPWLPSEDKRIREMVEQGNSDDDIARHLGPERSRSGVQERRRKLGIHKGASGSMMQE